MGDSGAPPTGYAAGRFTARPRLHAAPPPGHPGEYRPDADAGWSGVLYVPGGYAASAPLPLMLALHGATGRG
ncbi:MAG: hypothetical protein ACYDCQ_15045, partial [Dehalococcoidia bacterium]